MTEVLQFQQGGYRFIKGGFQYSIGVAAESGYEIVRARFAKPLGLAEGLGRIEAHIKASDRPIYAFCACELRSPKPFDDAGFLAFNRGYIEPLRRWGIIKDGINPVARSNVCPAVNPPLEPSCYAFSYTIPAEPAAPPSFVIAGSGEARGGQESYRERTVRLGDRSPDAIREKARWVLGEMERRMAAMGYTWVNSTATQLYTVYDIHYILADDIIGRGAADAGLTWQFCRPPVDVPDFEMDVRGVRKEIIIA
ncbi:MAG: 2-amino-5-chloromuconate deaminase CnbZ [Pseudolabrys sp.]